MGNRLLGSAVALIGFGFLVLCARAQEFTRTEVGLDTSVIHNNRLGVKTDAGLGARFTYNFTPSLALETETDYYLTRGNDFSTQTGGRLVSFFAGPKAGIRKRRFGIFFKAQPGIMSFSDVLTSASVNGSLATARKTHAALDLGGVLEFYPTQRIILRVDAGELLVRYGDATLFSSPNLIISSLGAIDNPLHISVGASYRLGRIEDAKESSSAPQPYQFGVQYSLQSLQRGLFTQRDESGVGGWFTYSFSRHFGLEVAGNYFPREQRIVDLQQGGRMAQVVGGLRWGIQHDHYGIFVKFRPGVQIYSLALEDDLRTIFQPHHSIPSFVNIAYDTGGIFEIYTSKHTLLRFDAGDTIIHFRERQVIGFDGNPITLPGNTESSIQLTAGFGLRF